MMRILSCHRAGRVALLAALLLAVRAIPAAEPIAVPDLVSQLNQAFIKVAETVSPTVVVIQVARPPGRMTQEDSPLWDMLPEELRRQFEEEHEKQQEGSESREPVFDGQGSGVLIRKEGFILTNRHVVDGAEKIKVRFADGAEYDAEVQGVDRQSDLAVLKINADKELPVAVLADSSKTRVGEFAIAIGAPFELDYSVTFGHVSAIGRAHIIRDPEMDQNFIQTDANINPGNSGGPLVNIRGEVIGINTLIRGLATGIGFAIPSNLAAEVAEKLISEGKYTRAFLGIVIRDLRTDPAYREMLPDLKDGVIVSEVRAGGPAMDSDLRAGDVVTAVDGVPVATGQELKAEVRKKKIGSAVTLDVHRQGKNIKVDVKTAPWPEARIPMFARQTPAEPKKDLLGLTVQTLTSELADEFGVDQKEGVIVTEVESGSPAHEAGLRAGDVITEVARKPVTNTREFREAMKGADLKKGVIVLYTSRGTSKFKILKGSGD